MFLLNSFVKQALIIPCKLTQYLIHNNYLIILLLSFETDMCLFVHILVPLSKIKLVNAKVSDM